jgi:hypothetical protein
MTIVIAFVFSLVCEQPFVALEQFMKKSAESLFKPRQRKVTQKNENGTRQEETELRF